VKRLLALAFCTAVAAGSTLNPAPAYSQDGTASLDDVVLLAQGDISDQTILTYLKHRRVVVCDVCDVCVCDVCV